MKLNFSNKIFILKLESLQNDQVFFLLNVIKIILHNFFFYFNFVNIFTIFLFNFNPLKNNWILFCTAF